MMGEFRDLNKTRYEAGELVLFRDSEIYQLRIGDLRN